MSFLDNLESSLKNLESQDERQAQDNHEKRQEQKANALAVAPWAEKLKQSAYVAKLLAETGPAGHKLRAKIYLAWLENTLRMEARGNFCEIRPSADGIRAEYLRLSDGSHQTEAIDLDGDPQALLQRWLFAA